MANPVAILFDSSKHNIVFGTSPKMKDSVIVDLPPNQFKNPPYVLVTPSWKTGAGVPETICDVTTTRFTLISANKAPDYVVYWVAIGDKPDVKP
jgi:hypothetical protein